MRSRRFGCVSSSLVFALFVAVGGCGGGDDVGITDEDTGVADTGPDDTGVADSAVDSPTDSPTDSATDSSGDAGDTSGDAIASDGDTTVADGDAVATDGDAPGDTADSGDAMAACGTLPTAPVDVYVDKNATTPSVGTAACPFHTLAAATAIGAPASGTRTIHVADVPSGGTPPVVYAEGGLEVKKGVILSGPGAAKVTISGSAACGAGGNCAVQVDGGGTVDGFTIGGAGVETTDGTLVATIKNSIVTGASGDGLRINGAADLGPNIQSNANTGNGLTIRGAGAVHVVAGTGVVNKFDTNGGDGINIGGTDCVLTFDGGEANGNAGDGVNIANVPSSVSTAAHSVTALVAKLNGFSGTTPTNHSGIELGDAAGLKLRNSVLEKNGAHGIKWTKGTAAGSSLDLGTAVSAGGNAFAGPTAADQNTKAGVCIENTPTANTFESDKWSACPPVSRQVSSCTATFSYADIAYTKTGSVTPTFVTTTCTVGP